MRSTHWFRLMGGGSLSGALVWGLLVALDDESCLASGVFDYALLAVGVNVTICALYCAIIKTSLFTKTLASWTAASVVAKLVVALQ